MLLKIASIFMAYKKTISIIVAGSVLIFCFMYPVMCNAPIGAIFRFYDAALRETLQYYAGNTTMPVVACGTSAKSNIFQHTGTSSIGESISSIKRSMLSLPSAFSAPKNIENEQYREVKNAVAEGYSKLMAPYPDSGGNENYTAPERIAYGAHPDSGVLAAAPDPFDSTVSSDPASGIMPYVIYGPASVVLPAAQTYAQTSGSVSPPDAVNQNRPPVFSSIGDKVVTEGSLLSFMVSASDPDSADSLIYTAGGVPQGAAFDPSTRAFTWTPGPGSAGVYNVIFVVSDGEFHVSEEIGITVILPDAVTLTLEPPLNGSISVTPEGPYTYGQSVRLTATPAGHYHLVNWTGDASALASENPVTITLDGDKMIGALFSQTEPLDTDGDGMEDNWETQYGLNPNDPSDAFMDADNDGLTNLEEYETGNDPKSNSNAVLRRPYTMVPAPNYTTTLPNDTTDLTDGAFTVGEGIWWYSNGVCWENNNPYADISFDLGSDQPISHVKFYTSGWEDERVMWPLHAYVLVSEDGSNYFIAGDLITLGAPPAPKRGTGGTAIKYCFSGNLNTHGRYIKLVIERRPGWGINCEEIQVFGGGASRPYDTYMINSSAATPENIENVLPNCLDRRSVWDTGFSVARLYLNTDRCTVKVAEDPVPIPAPVSYWVPVSVQIDDQYPYSPANRGYFINIPLTPNEERKFSIQFTSTINGVMKTEVKNIRYVPLGDASNPENPWQVKLADRAKIDPVMRGANTVLFDRADLDRIRTFKDDPDVTISGMWNSIIREIPGRLGGQGRGPLKTVNDFLVDAVVTEDPGGGPLYYATSQNRDIPAMAYVEIMTGPEAGRFRVAYPCEKISEGRWRMSFYSYTRNYMDIPANPAPLPKGTLVRILNLYVGTPQQYAMEAALGYSLTQEYTRAERDSYYHFARDMMLYDPMLGAGADSTELHSLCGYGYAYDMIKERLQAEDVANGTDYDARIRFKLARLMDFLTVNARSTNAWKYPNCVIDFVIYCYHGVGVMSHVLSDWVPPPGIRMTGPRDWMDNAMQMAHRSFENDLFGKDGVTDDGPMYANAMMADVTCFAGAHLRMTGINIVKDTRFQRCIEMMVRTRFGDGVLPSWQAASRLGYGPFSTLYCNRDIFGDRLGRMMKWVLEEEKAWYGDSMWYAGLSTSLNLYGVFTFDKEAIPLSPAEVMENDDNWRPTQFLPHGSQAIFRDSWTAASRQLVMIGKGEGIGNDWYSNVDLGSLIYYEDGEYLIVPDPDYGGPSSRYTGCKVLVDGQFSASQYDANGRLGHHYSHPAGLNEIPFVQTAEVRSFFKSPDETIESVLKKLTNVLYQWPQDYPKNITAGNYPDDVVSLRQVLYFRDYALLLDDISASKPHNYEVTFATPRLARDIDDSEILQGKMSWSGVEVHRHELYKRNQYGKTYGGEYDYITSENAKRRVRIQELTNFREITKGEYAPEMFGEAGWERNAFPRDPVSNKPVPDKLGYVDIQQTSPANTQFLTLISSDDNRITGDELIVDRLFYITGGSGATIEPPTHAYKDTVILHGSGPDASIVNEFVFKGKLMIARADPAGTAITDYYLKEPAQFTYKGKELLSTGGNIHHISLTIKPDALSGYVEALDDTTISLYSEYEPQPNAVTLTRNTPNSTFDNPQKETINLTYTLGRPDKMILINIPKGEGEIEVTLGQMLIQE